MTNDSLQTWASATTIAVTVLALVSVCLRLLARYERKQKLWWDDWLIIWSLGWNFVVVGFIFAMIYNGMGIHADTLPPEQVVFIAKFLVVAEILYVFNLVWTKLSVLCLYYRIFRFAYFKRWAYAIGTFIILWVICITFLFIFICVPVQKLWYPQLPGHCINQVGTWIANAISTIATDLMILILPMPQIWSLQLRTSQKVALTFAFCLGFFVVFASAYRFSVLFSYTTLDSSYTLAPTVGWTAIEMSAGIISACLPTMVPAFQFIVRLLGIKALVPSIFRTSGGSGSATAGSKSTAAQTAGSQSAAALNRVNRHSFYHLPDDNDSMERDDADAELSFRPKYDSSRRTTDVQGKGRGSVWGGEGVQLQGIRVQKEFMQTDS
ncbi:hypothetical protein BDW62DRAFT_215891 [Aspergillus aurantiobrunneus]